jgi:predicted amidohydrolase YtcJ
MIPSCAHVLDILQHAVTSAPPGTLLSGTIGPSAFFGQACTPATLDKMSLDDAIVLAMDSPHSGMLNQAAARKFGVREDDSPPLAGFFGKDMKSKPWDGVVHESAWFRIRELLMGDMAVSCWLGYHWRLLLTLRRSPHSQTPTCTSGTPARIPGDRRSR